MDGSLDGEDLDRNRTAWAWLLAGGAVGGTLLYRLLHHRPIDSAGLVYLLLFWTAPAAGLTAIVTHLFFAGDDRTITIARRYRRWKPVWVGVLLTAGTCTGAIVLLALWGFALLLATLLL